MLCYLLFYFLVLPFNIAHGASFALNAMNNPKQSTQYNAHENTEVNTTNNNDNDDNQKKTVFEENEEDGEDSENDDTMYNPTFRIKAIRLMRSIKKHSQLLIATLTGCTLIYLYWYKLWPFKEKTSTDTELQGNTQSSIDTLVEENITNNQTEKSTESIFPKEENITQKNIEGKHSSKITQLLPLVDVPEKSSFPAVSTYHIQELALSDNSNRALKKLEENTRNFTNKYSN